MAVPAGPSIVARALTRLDSLFLRTYGSSCAHNASDVGQASFHRHPYLAGKYRDYAVWGQDQAMPSDETFDSLLRDRFILGSPEELGVNQLVIRTHWAGMPLDTALHSMHLISTELIPELEKL